MSIDLDSPASFPLPDRVLQERLLHAWRDADRGYHDALHLTEVLSRLDVLEAAGASFDSLPVRLAAWFHDAVYDAAPAPEARSARWAAEELAATGLSRSTVDEVVRLVLLTERHDPDPDDANGQALCDADLAILAAPPSRYREYVAGVRREYARVNDQQFAHGRLAVLEPLARGPLFRTATGRALWEPAARANLDAEMAELRARVAAG